MILRTVLVTICLSLFCSHCFAVDRGNFKTCDDASFCKRHRKPQHARHPYIALKGTVQDESDSSVSITLENIGHKRQLRLSLSSYGDNRVGINIDEVMPIRKRFKPDDSFAKAPIKQKFKDISQDKASLRLKTLEDVDVIVIYEPFRIDIIDHGDLVVTMNSQSLLKFEHFRLKKEKKDETKAINGLQNDDGNDNNAEKNIDEEKVGDQDQTLNQDDSKSKLDADQNSDSTNTSTNDTLLDDDDEPGFWEEHWKSHADSKPYGSSSVGMDVSLVGFRHVYGIPEHADSFVLKSTTHTDPYRLYNLDVFEYELYNPMALYGSIPYIVGHNSERTIGIMWLNPSETWIDIKNSYADKGLFSSLLDKFKSQPEVPQIDTHWISEAGLIDIYVLLGPSPAELFRQFADLFGSAPLAPYFSLAYHQCRWNYNDMTDVQDVDANFDKFSIPYDTLWLDIEHTDGKRYFTWEPNKFCDPKLMIENLHSKGRNLVTIVDPHIKKDDNYYIYKDALNLGYFVKDKNHNVYEGWCWPGASMYLDFFNPEIRAWWGEQYSFQKYNASTSTVHTWNDMNEPSVFNGPEITMYKDNKHYGDWEHREVHNMYGFYHHVATYDGLLKRTGGKMRPFILTRSFFVGSQRYASVWTGDNTAEWSHLKIAFPMLLSLSVAGISFVGADVSGFFGNTEEELLIRWYQAGAFNPFFRAHSHLDTKRHEPWLFENGLKYMKDAILLRYKLLPFWYTTFYEHTVTGLPIMRPLWIEFPKDIYTYSEELSAMIGSALLVRPVTDQGATSVSVYLPGENVNWYDWDTFKEFRGPGSVSVETPLNKIPLFVRGGSILPLKLRQRRSTYSMEHDPLTLYVFVNSERTAANGTFYFDDGKTMDYQNGKFCYMSFEYVANQVSGSLSSSKIFDRPCQSNVLVEQIKIIGSSFIPSKASSSQGNTILVQYDSVTKAVVLRKPGLKIGTQWFISLS